MLLLIIAGACLISSGIIAPQDAIVLSEFVAEQMPTRQCHASTIAEVDGRLIAAWFGGEHEGSDDVGIWLSRKDSGAWTIPVRVADGGVPGGKVYPCWNPVLHKQRRGPLMLFYKVGPNPREWWGMVKTSTDCGVTWSEPRRLPDGIVGPVKNKPLEYENGLILCPSSTEDNGWQVWFERTTDRGATWSRIGPMNDPESIEAIQPSLLPRRDGILQAVGRTRQGRMFSMESPDSGRTWSTMRLLDFVCANSGLDGVVLSDGRLLVVYNHQMNVAGNWASGREMLNVSLSADGAKWEAACALEFEPEAEFSYPAVVQGDDGLVHVTYTWKRQRIRHVVLDPSRLEGRPFRDVGWE